MERIGMASRIDDQQFRGLLERIRPAMQQLFRHYRVPFHECEDLEQETWLALVKDWEAVASPEAWLLGTLRYQIFGFWRARRNRRIFAVDAEALARLAPVVRPAQVQRAAVLDFMALSARLPMRQRRILYFRYRLGLGSTEVAVHLGQLRETVRRDAHRAVARMQSMARQAEWSGGRRIRACSM